MDPVAIAIELIHEQPYLNWTIVATQMNHFTSDKTKTRKHAPNQKEGCSTQLLFLVEHQFHSDGLVNY